jgi:hypothetical protein
MLKYLWSVTICEDYNEYHYANYDAVKVRYVMADNLVDAHRKVNQECCDQNTKICDVHFVEEIKSVDRCHRYGKLKGLSGSAEEKPAVTDADRKYRGTE